MARPHRRGKNEQEVEIIAQHDSGDPARRVVVVIEDPPGGSVATSRIARAAQLLASAAALLALASAGGWALDWLSEREMVFALVLSFGGSILAATAAAFGWMHSRGTREGGRDPLGERRARAAGLLSGLVLVAVTLGLARLDVAHSVRAGSDEADAAGGTKALEGETGEADGTQTETAPDAPPSPPQ